MPLIQEFAEQGIKINYLFSSIAFYYFGAKVQSEDLKLSSRYVASNSSCWLVLIFQLKVVTNFNIQRERAGRRIFIDLQLGNIISKT
jgi:hypothetical protein